MSKANWNWDETVLADENTPYLSVKDIKQLLINRGENKKNIKGKRAELIKLLKTKYSVKLSNNKPFGDLTTKQLCVECKLRALASSGKKVALISRLHGHTKSNKDTFIIDWDNSLPGLRSSYYSVPVRINKNEFIIVNYCNPQGSTWRKGAWIFNCIDGEWVNVTRDINSGWDSQPTACLNDNGDILYALCGGHLWTFNIKDKSVKKGDNIRRERGYGNKLIYCHKQLHLIGGSCCNQHSIFDQDTNQFEINYHTFNQYYNGFWAFGLIKVNTRNMILLMGGMEGGSNQYAKDCILSYNISTKVWNVLDIKLPVGLSHFGYALTFCQRYVILLGGRTKRDKIIIDKKEKKKLNKKRNMSESIYILDLQEMIIRTSMVVCPHKSERYHAIIMSNEEKRNLIPFGFVKSIWKTEIFKAMRFPPDYIIRLILSYFMYESLHLLETGNENSGHWVMDVDYIINNSQITTHS